MGPMIDKKTERQKREDRLAENLRANLRRRKAATRKVSTKDKGDTASESS